MSWQDTLWTVPTEMGWVWYALWGVPALIGASLVFYKLILGHEFNALLIGRATFGIGALFVPLCALQSGWQPYIPAFYAVSIFLMGILIGTNWCERIDKSLTMPVALWRWGVRKFNEAVEWLCGPRRPFYRHEDVER